MYRFTASILTLKYVPTEKIEQGKFKGIAPKTREGLKKIKRCVLVVSRLRLPHHHVMVVITLVVLSLSLSW